MGEPLAGYRYAPMDSLRHANTVSRRSRARGCRPAWAPYANAVEVATRTALSTTDCLHTLVVRRSSTSDRPIGQRSKVVRDPARVRIEFVAMHHRGGQDADVTPLVLDPPRWSAGEFVAHDLCNP